MNTLLYLACLTTTCVCLVGARCPAACQCPARRPVCPPGVSLVADGCGCCKVCAAQLNQDCSPALPCDRHKGLRCNYGNDVASTWGVCRAKVEGRSCEYSGRIYQNGEAFRAGCKHQCTCIDGAVGCAPLCTARLPLASPECPHPRLVRVPGQCCFSVDCHRGALPLPPRPGLSPHPNKLDRTLANNLVEDHQKGRGSKRLEVWNPPQSKCVVQTTDWSQCSSSCGMGVSSRITNGNAQCKLQKETRLCNVRPCTSLKVPPKKGRKCTRMQKSPGPVHLSYAGCRSARPYRPNYCGACSDGRCCTPQRTRTLATPFLCPVGRRVERAVMVVQSCKCSHDCSHLNEALLPPQRWLYGDTHKFAD
ncbi:protein CYR61-like [Denticeps clupeoides]|uniref:Uncharacterized protein n=1 Tax=Denticeps clupeoides TaxID=299321 RepID=A0AAY4B5G3_9TELE|nr:protein CYR61-like [Denticeps clupeoides]